MSLDTFKRVAYVDDMDGEREMMRMLYKQCEKRFHDDVEFVGLASWEEAIEYFKANKVDVLLLDLTLPPFSADQTLKKMCEEITSHPEFPPVVVLTGSVEKENRPKAIWAGADDYILKTDLHGHAERLCERVYLAHLRRVAHAKRAQS